MTTPAHAVADWIESHLEVDPDDIHPGVAEVLTDVLDSDAEELVHEIERKSLTDGRAGFVITMSTGQMFEVVVTEKTA